MPQDRAGFVGLRSCLAAPTSGGTDEPAVPRSTMVRPVPSLRPEYEERDQCRVQRVWCSTS